MLRSNVTANELRYFDATTSAGGFQVPSPGGRIDGYRRSLERRQ